MVSGITFCTTIKCKGYFISLPNYDLIINFGNIARKFLEIHLFFKYPYFSNDKIFRFFANDEISGELINRLCNESSHFSLERAQRCDEIPEAVTAAKKIIDKLKEDKEQFDSLIKSLN
jgi:hypothetical protein